MGPPFQNSIEILNKRLETNNPFLPIKTAELDVPAGCAAGNRGSEDPASQKRSVFLLGGKGNCSIMKVFKEAGK
ncbi:conserved domain protein [delta proteobacterium NaphS2]|nr:conserved domain protein [delta proteobacterium NaphS2]